MGAYAPAGSTERTPTRDSGIGGRSLPRRKLNTFSYLTVNFDCNIEHGRSICLLRLQTPVGDVCPSSLPRSARAIDSTDAEAWRRPSSECLNLRECVAARIRCCCYLACSTALSCLVHLRLIDRPLSLG